MISTPQTLFKLMILFFLDSVDFSLSNAIISDFFLDRGYTDYFNMQTFFNELEEEKLISSSSTHKSTCYKITAEGKMTLDCFHYEISPDIKNEIKTYLKEHFNDIIEMLSISSDYSRLRTNEYIVTCKICERDTLIASVSITVASEELARLACENWAKNNSAIYSFIIKSLL